MTQKTAITLRASAEVLKVLDAKAEAEFCSRAEAGNSMLEAACAQSTGEPSTASPLAGVKEESATVDLEMKKLRLHQLRKRLLTVEGAVGVVESTFADMKVEGHTFINDIADEFGLDAEKLRRRFDEVMAGAMTVERETYQRLADDFSNEALPQ